jgi:hypothetical protein
MPERRQGEGRIRYSASKNHLRSLVERGKHRFGSEVSIGRNDLSGEVL